MLAHPTSDRLIALGLSGMARALDDQRRTPACEAMTFEERLGLLVDRGEPEQTTIRWIVVPANADRDSRRLATRLKFAALRHAACIEDVDLRTPRGIDRAVFAHLADGGPPGLVSLETAHWAVSSGASPDHSTRDRPG